MRYTGCHHVTSEADLRIRKERCKAENPPADMEKKNGRCYSAILPVSNYCVSDIFIPIELSLRFRRCCLFPLRQRLTVFVQTLLKKTLHQFDVAHFGGEKSNISVCRMSYIDLTVRITFSSFVLRFSPVSTPTAFIMSS